jgi:hypothetical protein
MSLLYGVAEFFFHVRQGSILFEDKRGASSLIGGRLGPGLVGTYKR